MSDGSIIEEVNVAMVFFKDAVRGDCMGLLKYDSTGLDKFSIEKSVAIPEEMLPMVTGIIMTFDMINETGEVE